MALLPLLSVQVDAEWSPELTCTDASDTGFGIVHREHDISKIAEAGRQSEKWRFGVARCVQARAHALGAAALQGNFELDPASLKPLDLDLEAPTEEEERLFSEVPSE